MAIKRLALLLTVASLFEVAARDAFCDPLALPSDGPPHMIPRSAGWQDCSPKTGTTTSSPGFRS